MNKNGKNIIYKIDVIYFFIFLMLFIFMFKNFFFTDSVFFERDSTLIEIPSRILCVKLLREGSFALWTDAYGNGQPFLANPKNAVFYPTTLLYLFLPFFISFKIHYLIHVLICWTGLYFFSQSFSLSKKASFFGATIFILSGMFLSSFEFYNHIAALCWMPWILFILNKFKDKFLIRLIVLSILWSLLILAGTPYVIIITFISGLILIIFSKEKAIRKVKLLIFPLIIAIFISAIQLLPSLELMVRSERAIIDPTQWSFQIIQLPNFVFPNFLGNDREPGHNDFWGGHLFDKGYPLYYSFYISFGVLILFFLGLQKPYDKRHVVLIVTFFTFFFMSFGKYSPFFFMFKYIPPFSTLRYPVKYLMGAIFSLSIISAIAFDNLFRYRKTKNKQLFIIFFLSLFSLTLYLIFKEQLLTLLGNFFVIDNKQSISELNLSFIHGFLIFIICSFIILLSGIFHSSTKFLDWILIFVILFDLVITNRTINPVVSISFFKKPDILKTLEPPFRVYRDDYLPTFLKKEVGSSFNAHNYLRQSLYPFCGLGDDVEYQFNKDFYGLYSEEYHKIRKFLKECDVQALIKILSLSGCHYYITHHPLSNLPAKKKVIEGYTLYFQKIKKILKFPYLVFDSIRVKSIDKKMKILGSENFDPKKIAIVGKEINLSENFNNKKNYRIITLEEKQGKKRYLIESSSSAIAVFYGNYYPGWKAWVDGKRVRIFKVNLTSKGIVVPSGRHEIVLKYLPNSFIYGAIITFTTLVGIIIVSIIFIIKKGGLKNRPPEPSELSLCSSSNC
ncbi:YfhO family protein [Candidatus Aminicenantes bacterium AC-708-M15]|jgi:hypothetical protein|nr:YfhO family protein [SCandidatus Aminicenantes bacterium Aminicenantia_JdfR_composite]MCP2596799.1 YfhO family protein [Candidatus Aminicenantes bacterium AC-335-G13]MCP2598260.1 YfhO family protein [Candidatus Aminicenantes bacterium AC-335-L06]MCP2603999.1 YfhO family protein [Candidatus Aminicenantes bacterium AC-708-M15]